MADSGAPPPSPPPPPPPPPPRVREARDDSRRVLLILDLNHFVCDRVRKRGDSAASAPRPQASGAEVVELKHEYVVPRPHARGFVDRLLGDERFAVAVWTSARASNAQALLAAVLTPEQRQELLFVWGQEQCVRGAPELGGGGGGAAAAALAHGASASSDDATGARSDGAKPLLLKPLEAVWRAFPASWGRENTLLLDDTPAKALLNPPHTAIHPLSWHHQYDSARAPDEHAASPSGGADLTANQQASGDDEDRAGVAAARKRKAAAGAGAAKRPKTGADGEEQSAGGGDDELAEDGALLRYLEELARFCSKGGAADVRRFVREHPYRTLGDDERAELERARAALDARRVCERERYDGSMVHDSRPRDEGFDRRGDCWARDRDRNWPGPNPRDRRNWQGPNPRERNWSGPDHQGWPTQLRPPDGGVWVPGYGWPPQQPGWGAAPAYQQPRWHDSWAPPPPAYPPCRGPDQWGSRAGASAPGWRSAL